MKVSCNSLYFESVRGEKVLKKYGYGFGFSGKELKPFSHVTLWRFKYISVKHMLRNQNSFLEMVYSKLIIHEIQKELTLCWDLLHILLAWSQREHQGSVSQCRWQKSFSVSGVRAVLLNHSTGRPLLASRLQPGRGLCPQELPDEHSPGPPGWKCPVICRAGGLIQNTALSVST